MKKLKTVVVFGKRWFDKKWGNTYHSVFVTAQVEGEKLPRYFSRDFEYGYDNHFVQTAKEMLETFGLIKPEKYDNGSSESLARYCERKGIFFVVDVADVARRKDLAP